MSERKAVVLLSGGLDSATALAVAKSRGFSVHALTFQYGQRHSAEVESAKLVASNLGVTQHFVATIDLRAFGGSALTSSIAVPQQRAIDEMATGIPVTYVPARNTIFLAFALAWAETLASNDVFIGVNAVDYSGYPDCRPEFITEYEKLANLATKRGVEGEALRIHAPLITLSKADIIREGLALNIDYSLTRSCYNLSADGTSCGACDSCIIRRNGFAANGRLDPIPYAR